MRSIITFFALVGALTAQPVSPGESARLDRETKARFDQTAASLLRDADSVVIRALLPPIKDSADVATVSDQRAVRSLAKKFKAAKSQGPWVRMKDGFIISETSGPCQCWREFEFQFFAGKKKICTVSLHHWTHVWSELLTGGADVSLESKSMNQLYDAACTALPAYGARVKKPNQSPEPTRGKAPRGSP